MLGRSLAVLLALALSAPLVVASGGLLAGPVASTSGARGFLAGFGLAIIAAPLISRFNFVNTFAHEVGHMVFALITGGRMLEFVATDRSGGHVRHEGAFSLPVTIAPYSVPLLAFAVLGVSLMQRPVPGLGFASAMGVTAGYHAVRAVADLRLNFAYGIAGSDLARFGPLPTLAWIWLVNVAAFGSLLAYTGNGISGLVTFWVTSWQETTVALHGLAGYGTDMLADLAGLAAAP